MKKHFFARKVTKKECKLKSEIKYTLLRIAAGRIRGRLRFNPLHQKGHNGSLFPRLQLPALRDTMPAMQAAATTTRAGMLCLEHGMPAHGRLVTVPRRIGRRQPLLDEGGRVGTYRIQTHTLNVGGIVCRQPKTATKFGLHQTRQRRRHKRKRNRRAVIAQAIPKKDDVTETISCSRDPGRCRLPS